MINEEEMLEIKLILLGESAVGKTSIISRYVKDQFQEGIPTSSTMCYVGKKIEKNNRKIKLNIWDTIGQEKFRAISKLFLNDTKIVILVYSITSRASFENLDYWLNLYKDNLEEGTILGVAANKSDLFLQQEVPDEEGRKYAEKNNAIFALLSAKENKGGIHKFIGNLVDAYLAKENIDIGDDNKKIKLDAPNKINEKSNSSCCSKGNKKDKQQRYKSIVVESRGNLNSVFLGNKGVGKTSIINIINGKQFNNNEEHTEEINKITVKYIKDQNIKFIIYDVDNDKMRTKEFIEVIKKCNIFFLVYDVNNKESLEDIEFWIDVIKKCKDLIETDIGYLLYIIGNKDDALEISQEEDKEKDNGLNQNEINDNINKRYIEEGKEKSQINDAVFKIVSAKENKGIDKLVEESVENYLTLKLL